jgi:hypothetical protein
MINPALNAAVIPLYLQVYVAAMLVFFITENSDVVTLRGKNKESEIFISRLMETETTSVLRYGSTVLDKLQGFRHTFYML